MYTVLIIEKDILTVLRSHYYKNISQLLKKWAVTISFLFILKGMIYGQHFTTANNKMNVMYIGVDNPVAAMVEGYRCDQINIVMDSAQITPLGGCRYNINPKLPGLQSLKIFVETNGVEKLIDQYQFRVKYIPDAVCDAYEKNFMFIKVLKSTKDLYAILDYLNVNSKWVVDSFRVEIYDKKINTFSVINKGATFSQDILAAFNKTAPGNRIFFEDIDVRGPDNRKRVLMSIIFTLL